MESRTSNASCYSWAAARECHSKNVIVFLSMSFLQNQLLRALLVYEIWHVWSFFASNLAKSDRNFDDSGSRHDRGLVSGFRKAITQQFAQFSSQQCTDRCFLTVRSAIGSSSKFVCSYLHSPQSRVVICMASECAIAFECKTARYIISHKYLHISIFISLSEERYKRANGVGEFSDPFRAFSSNFFFVLDLAGSRYRCSNCSTS
jgi:hypothetical protein